VLRELSRSGLAVLLGLTVIVPFLNYYRVKPSSTFYSEAAAGVLFLLAVAASGPLLQRTQRVHASFAVFTFGLLAILAYQVLSSRYFQFSLSWSAWAAYLVIFLLAAALGQLAASVPDLRTVIVDRLAHAFVMVALLNAVAQVAQVTGWAQEIMPFVFVPGDEELAGYACSPAGNVAQRNHANALAWLGIGFLLYLIATKRCRGAIGAIGLGILLLSSALTSARMAWLMALALAALLQVAGRGFDWTWRRSTLVGAALMLGLLVATWAKGLVTGADCTTSLDRALGPEGADYRVRLDLMRQALMVWWSAPILGVGAGKFMATTFALEPRRDIVQPLDYFPHNAPLEMLASFGIAGGGLLLACGAVWIGRAWRNRVSAPEHLPMLGGLAVLSIHALLEMPLWYLYFLIPFGLMLGIAVGPVRAGERSATLPWHWVFVVAMLLGIPGFVYAVVDHARAERIIWLGRVAKEHPELAAGAVTAMRDGLGSLRIFAIAGERELLRFGEIDRANAVALAVANRRLLENIPDPVVISRQVMLEAIAGRPDEARDLFRRMMMFYPRHYDVFAMEIIKRAKAQPEETAGLVGIIEEELARTPRTR
jgi:O-antigen ligase